VGDALILATPANVAAELLGGVAPEAASLLKTIRHASIGTLTLAFRSSELKLGFPISGLMIPRRERRAIDAVTFTSERFPDRSPTGYTLVRIFFGGAAPHMLHLDDAALEAAVRGELRALLGITAQPVARAVARWPQSYPQADVGHLELVQEVEAALPAGLFVTGSAYRGLGVPDCVAQGRESGRAAVERLQAVVRPTPVHEAVPA
jgi:oxygen-dependent protoporphyrinogen oxidase